MKHYNASIQCFLLGYKLLASKDSPPTNILYYINYFNIFGRLEPFHSRYYFLYCSKQTVILLLLHVHVLLLGGHIRDLHNATPSISVRHKCLHVCYLMPNISCNAVNVIQWFSSSGWARQSQGNHRYYLILGAKKKCYSAYINYNFFVNICMKRLDYGVNRDDFFFFCNCSVLVNLSLWVVFFIPFRILKHLASLYVVKVCCGSLHSMALTRGNQLRGCYTSEYFLNSVFCVCVCVCACVCLYQCVQIGIGFGSFQTCVLVCTMLLRGCLCKTIH